MKKKFKEQVKERKSKRVKERISSGKIFSALAPRWSINRPFTLSLFRSLMVTLSLFLIACGSEERQTAYIPDVPKAGDSSRVSGALRALTSAIIRSSPASAYAKRAVIYLTMGRVNDALTDIDEAIDRNDNVGGYYLTRAQILRMLQQPVKALQNAQRAEILGVDTPELYTLQGDLLQQQNQFDKAKLYLAKALQMAPYDGEAYFYSGLITARLGDTTQALALYEQSLRLKPRFLETYNQLSSVYRTLGNVNAALLYSEQAMRYFPHNAKLCYGRGLIYHTEGKLDSAVMYYQQTVSLQPMYYQAFFQMGLISQKYRNYYNALTSYQRVQQLRPQFPRIETYIGYCYEQTGQYDLAIASYTEATKLNAADRQAAAGLWRSQRRQYAQNSYNSLFLPDTIDKPRPTVRTRPVFDTTRVRISTIQPKARVSTNTSDTLRRSVKPIGQN